jgi:hypothetical protein
MKDRQPLPDLLKGIAVLAMIQVHVMEQFARPEILAGSIGKLSLFFGGPFAAPVFMAVMGYFTASVRQEGRDGAGRRFRRGVLLVLLGILLNIGLNFNLLLHIFIGEVQDDPWKYVFGADILPLAGLSLIFIGFMELIPGKKAPAAILMALVVTAVSPFLNAMPPQSLYLQAFFTGTAAWSYFPVFPWLAYSLAGYSWARSGREYPLVYKYLKDNILWVNLLSLALLIALALFAFTTITNLPEYYHHGILLFLWISGFIVLWVQIGQVVIKLAEDSTMVRYLRWLGKNVTVVYVIQWLLIGNLAFHLKGSQFPLQMLLWLAGILALTSFLTYLYLLWKKSWFSA